MTRVHTSIVRRSLELSKNASPRTVSPRVIRETLMPPWTRKASSATHSAHSSGNRTVLPFRSIAPVRVVFPPTVIDTCTRLLEKSDTPLRRFVHSIDVTDKVLCPMASHLRFRGVSPGEFTAFASTDDNGDLGDLRAFSTAGGGHVSPLTSVAPSLPKRDANIVLGTGAARC